MKGHRKLWISIFMAAVGLALVGAVRAGGVYPDTATVQIYDGYYAPSAVTVTLRGRVTWVNNGALSHTVKANDNSFFSGILVPGAQYGHVFDRTGVFSYTDTLGAGKGVVYVVQQVWRVYLPFVMK